MSDKNNNNNTPENKNNLPEKENNEEQRIENKTSEELLSTIAENIFEYFQKNKDNLKGMSLEEIFFAYVEENNDIIQEVESKLGKELSFNDIKHLYLKTHYTLEEGLTKDIFKNFQEKKAIKSIIKVFERKIKEKGFIEIDFNQFLQTEIESDKDIDNLFTTIKDYLHKYFKNISSEDKEKIKNTKITNEEIIKQLIDDGIIKNEDYLKESIDTLRQKTDEEIKNILNIHSTLLNANIINNINDIQEGFDKLQKDLLKIGSLGRFSDILKKYDINKIDKNEINEIYELLSINNESLKIDKDYETKYPNKVLDIKKEKVLKAMSEDPNLYIDYISNHEKDNNEEGLAEILKKILNNNLTEKDKHDIINKFFKKEYIENISRIVSTGFHLTKEETKIYEDILSQLLDPNKNTLSLPNGIEIEIKKNVILPEIKTIDELFETEPVIKFEITGDNVNYFKNIFPNYFTRFNNQDYSIFTKVKIKDKEQNEYIGYIQEGPNNTIEIYDNNPIDNNTNPIKILNKDEIENISCEEENKLILDSRSDLRKLAISMISYFDKYKKDYTYYEIKNQIDEAKSKNKENTELNEDIDYQIDIEKFKKEWGKLEGDENTEFKVGATIQIKGKALELPGIRNNWFYAEIIDINEKTGYFKIRLNSGGILPLEGEGNEYEIPMIAKWITKLKFGYGGNVFKFNKINTIQDLGRELKDINLKSDFQGLQKGLSLWANNIEVKDNKLVRKNENGEYEEINYMGKLLDKTINNANPEFYVWKIEVKNNKIHLTHPYDKNFSRTVDLNTFLMIIMQNELQPWTEKDFKEAEINGKKTQIGKLNIRLYSFSSIILSFKQLKENFSYYFKEDDDLKAAEMYAKLAGSLPNWWFFRDIKMEANGEKESKIWRLIENAKSRLERAGEGKGKNHGTIAASIIKKEIFDKAKEGKKLSYRTKLKAAGYLIYALEKGPGPYFRALANYEGEGLWVKALLGEEHYNIWKSRNHQLTEQLKKDPENEIIRDELIKSEIFYIKDLNETANLYTANFGSTIEGLIINNVYSGGKVNDAYEGESTKGNYYLIRDGLKSYILNNRPANSLGALKALSERVETYEQYIDYYKIISSFIFTGYLYNNYNISFREQFDKICRTYGVPIGLFAKELNGLNKLLKIFDYIVKEKNIKPGGKSSFTEFLYGRKNPDNIDVMSIKYKSQRAEIIKKLEEFWNLHGEEIVSTLDYTDITLFKEENIDKIPEIKDYFNKVNDNIIEDFSFADELGKTAYAPYYQNGIFNVPAGPFQRIALSLDEGEFTGKYKTVAEGIWNGIALKLEGMEDIANNEEVYEFILRKYLNWFGRFYKGEYKDKFIDALKSGDSNKLYEMIVEFSINNYGFMDKIPPEMKNGLKQFVKCFKKRPKNIDKILNKVFG